MTSDRQKEECERYKTDFGEKLGPALYAFKSRLVKLHRRWRDYDTLYCSDLRVDILNKFAPSFFSRHQEMTFECVVMALARFSDPERTGKRENLSLAFLLSLLETKEKGELAELADRALHKSAFAREWRNKRFAHHDLEDAVDQAVPIGNVTHMQIDEAIVALNRFVEQLHVKCGGYSECALSYAYQQNDFGGAHVLLGRLHEANKARDENTERIKAGFVTDDSARDDDPVWKDLRR